MRVFVIFVRFSRQKTSAATLYNYDDAYGFVKKLMCRVVLLFFPFETLTNSNRTVRYRRFNTIHARRSDPQIMSDSRPSPPLISYRNSPIKRVPEKTVDIRASLSLSLSLV